MLRVNRLVLENFGPYKGLQTIDFPGNGITIVYGENGHGKTHLLNGIRYALFGEMLGRHSEQLDLAQASNWESGTRSFRASLELSQDGIDYRLTRRFAPLDADPSSPLVESFALVRNEQPLGPEEALAELHQLLPKTIARFFLFDGELLEEYEELLKEGSELGEKLAESIERILGVPVLANARLDVAECLSAAVKRRATAAERDQRTRQIGAALLSAQEALDAARGNVGALRGQVAELDGEKRKLEARMATNARSHELIGERDQLKVEIAGLKTQLAQAREDVERLATDAWRGVLGPTIASMRHSIDGQVDALETRRNAIIVRQSLAARARKLVAGGSCPTCQQSIPARAIHALVEDREESEVSSADIDLLLADARRRRQLLDRMLRPGYLEQLAEAEERQSQIEIAYETSRAELQAKEDKLKGVKEADVVTLAKQYSLVDASLQNTRARLEAQEAEVVIQTGNVDKFSAQLDRAPVAETEQLTRQVALLRDIEQTLGAAIADYRDRLRTRVEAEASKLFVSISSEPEYVGLQINENYGLTIMHVDGQPIPVRSAGYEHIVALALVGALQRSAPISGPVIIDSPFGRLDGGHKRRLVAALPEMAKQVVLLVYEDELDRQVALSALGENLKSEKKLRKLSARHTIIEDRT